MTPDALPRSLEAGSAARVVAPGELLFRQGDRATAIYKVESGRLRLIRRTVDDHLVILHTAHRGEFFAEASLLADAYHCDAVAAAQSRVRVYPKAIVMEALRTDPALRESRQGLVGCGRGDRRGSNAPAFLPPCFSVAIRAGAW
jgi:CRP/FNR family transcriptional regulator, dissimilatory nitrate respiration regulator